MAKRSSEVSLPPATRPRLELTSLFTRLSDEERQRIFSFLATLPAIAIMGKVNKLFCATVKSSAVWQGVTVIVEQRVLESVEGIQALVKLGTSSWGLAAEVCLPAHSMRLAVMNPLQEKWPELKISVVGEGPHCLFVMGAGDFPVGSTTGLHFFEPRYRWMCRRILAGPEPHLFGFVTSGRTDIGARGMLCKILQWNENDNETFDVMVQARRSFTILEKWTEEVPDSGRNMRMPALLMGYLKLYGPQVTPEMLQREEARVAEMARLREEFLETVQEDPYRALRLAELHGLPFDDSDDDGAEDSDSSILTP